MLLIVDCFFVCFAVRMNGPAGGEAEDYKRRYKNLKRKLKFLIYEQECFQEELRRAQRKLLRVSRDKSFLLDRIIQYENVDDDSSVVTTLNLRRKRSPSAGPSSPPPSSSSALSLHTSGGPYLSAMSSPPYTPFPSEYLAPLPNSTSPIPERVKRDRRSRGVKPRKPKIALSSPSGVLPFSPRSSGLPPLSSSSKHAPPPPVLSTVPQQMFSDGGEGSGDEGPMDGDEEDDLVIDIPE
ncbi:unnamed protein product [Ranitomeya imitator]|uniref:INO80 complex subunit E N-terminal domain-containing protein n=1 Tax=Ranitomeya imitator TaxID=111125 RepID=A0ABN9MIW7_9NEOB|nr:unnamed protein product [Ranitomeya imitator]